jgi:hypothetical protein
MAPNEANNSLFGVIRYHSDNSLQLILRDEAADRAIVRSFPLRTEETAWKLLHPRVIGDTLAASPLAVTGFIGTGASNFVLI